MQLRDPDAAAMKRVMPAEERARRAEAARRNAADPEVNAKRAAAMRARWADPDYRAQALAKLKRGHSDPLRNAKISATARAKAAERLPAKWEIKRTITTLEKALAKSERLRVEAEREIARLRDAARDLALARERIERLERELREARFERVSAASIARRLAA